MQKEQLEGQWSQLKSQIKQKWNKLSDADLTACNGKFDALCNCIQKAYGCKKEQAEQQIRDFKPEHTSAKSDSRQGQGQPQQGQPRQGQPQTGNPQRQGQPGQSQKEKGPEQREKARM